MLTGPQLDKLRKILNPLFDPATFEMALRGTIDRRIYDIVKESDLPTTIYRVLERIDQEGTLLTFLDAVIGQFPLRTDLPDLFGEFRLATANPNLLPEKLQSLTIDTPGSQCPLVGREKIFEWIGAEVINAPRLHIRGKTGVGRTAILRTINDLRDQHLENSPRKFKRIAVVCKTPSNVQDAFSNFVEKIASEFGYEREALNELPRILETLARLLKNEPHLLLLDDFHELYNSLNANQKTELDRLLSGEFTKSCVIATSNLSEDRSMASWSNFKRKLTPLTEDQMRTLYDKFCNRIGWESSLNEPSLQNLINACDGLPKLLETAVHQLSEDEPVEKVIHRINTQSRGSAEANLTLEEEIIVAAICFAPSRDRGIVEYLARLASTELDFDAVLTSLQKLYPGLRASDMNVPQPLLDDGESLLKSREQIKDAFQIGLRKWAAELVVRLPMWERDDEQYDKAKRHQDDLKYAADLDLSSEKRLISTESLITITRIIHHFGAWDNAASLMRRILPASKDENQIILWLLLARHHSYQGEDEEAGEWLALVEKETQGGTAGSETMRVQYRLRRGQSNRRSDPKLAGEDLQYVMDRGTVYDYLVAAGFVAEMHLDKRQYDEARRVLKTAMSLQTDLVLPWERIRAHHNRQLGELAAKHGEWSTARQHFEAAAKGSKWAADQRLLGWSKLGLALCSCSEADAADALKNLEPLGKVASRELKRAQGLLRYIRSCTGVRPAPVILTGGPAAGKTTLRASLACWLVENGIPATVTGVDEAQRLLYPPLNLLGQPYEYDEAGALILKDRETQIPRAYDALAHLLENPAHRHAVQLVEFAHPDPASVIKRIGNKHLQNAIVLMLEAPVDTRLRRNEERKNTSSYIPDAVVRDFSVSIDEDRASPFDEIGATLIELDASQTREQVFEVAKLAIVNHRRAWFEASSGVTQQSMPQ